MRSYKALTILVLGVFFLQNCMTIFRSNPQSVPITSQPTGAKIIVDGKDRGHTPLSLQLKRKANHTLRIERQGYNPLEIRITRNTSAGLSILGNLTRAHSGLGRSRSLGLFIRGEPRTCTQ